MRRCLYNVIGLLLGSRRFRTAVIGFYRRVLDFPKVLQLSCTSACNLSCVYCYVDRGVRVELAPERCFALLREAQRMGVRVLTLTGGEPFLYPFLRETLERAAGMGFSLEILTNGTLITDEWLAFLTRINRSVPLSLSVKFSGEAQACRFHTGSDSYRTVAQTVRRCTEAGLVVFTFTVVTRREYGNLDSILGQALDSGAWPVFQRYIPVKDAATNAMLEVTAEEYQDALLRLRRFYEVHSERLGKYRGVAAELRGSVCACYRDMAHIAPGGEILPCPLAPPELSLGNIRETSLGEAWRRLRRKRDEWLRLTSRCAGCSVRHRCGGGCISHRYIAGGSFLADDPMCFRPGVIPAVEGLSGPSRVREAGGRR